MSLRIAPSLLASDFGALADAAAACERGGADYLHFDVMDGQFVPNISFGVYPVEALRPRVGTKFDVHFMIVQPDRFIDDFCRAGADMITVQAEATVHVQRTLAAVRDAGARAGLALNPATPLAVLDYLMADIDRLLVMTVNPGFGGQQFLPAMLPKIRQARERIDAAGLPIELAVDGGIGCDTAPQAVEAGADVLIAGTSVFRHPEGPAGGIRALREIAGRR